RDARLEEDLHPRLLRVFGPRDALLSSPKTGSDRGHGVRMRSEPAEDEGAVGTARGRDPSGERVLHRGSESEHAGVGLHGEDARLGDRRAVRGTNDTAHDLAAVETQDAKVIS